MANICSLNLHLNFKTKKDCRAFKKELQKRLDFAESRNIGLKIAKNKWLFDGFIDDEGDKGLAVHGSVRWCLEQESMVEFTKYLRKWKVKSFTCGYEETSCCVFGEYSFDGTELWDKYIPDSHPVWHQTNTGEDDYFDAMDQALVDDGVDELVA